jgi:hypothetical protein
LDRRLGGPQSWSGCGGEEKSFQSLPKLQHPVIQPTAQCYTTVLFWLTSNRYKVFNMEGKIKELNGKLFVLMFIVPCPYKFVPYCDSWNLCGQEKSCFK